MSLLLEESTNGRVDYAAGIHPYRMAVEVEGTANLLFHRYDPAVVDRKSKATKGSAERMTDHPEDAVYRDGDGVLCLPATNWHAALANAAKFVSDPRSSGRRKQAGDLFKAAVIVLPDLVPFRNSRGEPATSWDFVDRRGVVVQRARVNRERPGLLAGWRARFIVEVLAADYVEPQLLREVLGLAGRFCAVGDFRPNFGRFQVVLAEVTPEAADVS